jgi:hypothetical protein
MKDSTYSPLSPQMRLNMWAITLQRLLTINKARRLRRSDGYTSDVPFSGTVRVHSSSLLPLQQRPSGAIGHEHSTPSGEFLSVDTFILVVTEMPVHYA